MTDAPLLNCIELLLKNTSIDIRNDLLLAIQTMRLCSYENSIPLVETGIEEAFVAALKIALPSRDNSLKPTEIIELLTELIPNKDRATELVQKVTTELNSLSVRFFGLPNPTIALNNTAIKEMLCGRTAQMIACH